jgi:hypothetical protein
MVLENKMPGQYYFQRRETCPTCHTDEWNVIESCPDCEGTICNECGGYDEKDLLVCKRCATERAEEREFLALGEERGAVLSEPTVPKLGDTMVAEQWDGTRWMEHKLRWNGAQFGEVA